MKKYILFTLLFISLISLSADTTRHHTCFLLNNCMNSSRLETQSLISFLKTVAPLLEVNLEESTILTNEDLLHQDNITCELAYLASKTRVFFCDTVLYKDIHTGELSYLSTPMSVVFCTALTVTNEVLIDIYTEKEDLNINKISEFCIKHFESESNEVSFIIPYP